MFYANEWDVRIPMIPNKIYLKLIQIHFYYV